MTAMSRSEYNYSVCGARREAALRGQTIRPGRCPRPSDRERRKIMITTILWDVDRTLLDFDAAESAAIRRQLRGALLAADFTPPSITNATDEISQHYVYEFEDVGGLADG